MSNHKNRHTTVYSPPPIPHYPLPTPYTLPFPNPPLPASQSPEPDDESYDALDEVLGLYRANTFFRNFEIQGAPDRLLIYGILWCGEVVGKVRALMSVRYVCLCVCVYGGMRALGK